jgi:hypothetical protein
MSYNNPNSRGMIYNFTALIEELFLRLIKLQRWILWNNIFSGSQTLCFTLSNKKSPESIMAVHELFNISKMLTGIIYFPNKIRL